MSATNETWFYVLLTKKDPGDGMQRQITISVTLFNGGDVFQTLVNEVTIATFLKLYKYSYYNNPACLLEKLTCKG